MRNMVVISCGWLPRNCLGLTGWGWLLVAMYACVRACVCGHSMMQVCRGVTFGITFCVGLLWHTFSLCGMEGMSDCFDLLLGKPFSNWTRWIGCLYVFIFISLIMISFCVWPQLVKLTLPVLKEFLRQVGLPVVGKKSDLMDRIKGHFGLWAQYQWSTWSYLRRLHARAVSVTPCRYSAATRVSATVM